MEPQGEFEGFSITCSGGLPFPHYVSSGQPYEASCMNLPTAGEEYNMTISTVSGTWGNPGTITVTARMS